MLNVVCFSFPTEWLGGAADDSRTGIPFRRGYLLHGVPGRYDFLVSRTVVEHATYHKFNPVVKLL